TLDAEKLRMKVLFSNPPWWGERKTQRGRFFRTTESWVAGVRAGSRWPFTYDVQSAPDRFKFGDYLPYPFFMGYAATYAAKHTDAAITFRDSIALRESYDRYHAFLAQERFDVIVVESASPSWDHDRALIREIDRRLPGTRFIVTGPIASNAKEILEKDP